MATKTDMWAHADEWKRSGTGFTVTVKRWAIDMGTRVANKWNVYAYIRPRHPRFDDLSKTTNGRDDAFMDFPFHKGVTYYRRHIGEKTDNLTCIEVGSDYSHLHDERFETFATRDDAWEVFADADQLFGFLSSPVVATPATTEAETAE